MASQAARLSTFRPVGDADGRDPARDAAERLIGAIAATHQFDAGTMSCADGLASEFRRRIGAIPVGDVIAVTARDPAAKEDLPPLARMLGHTVRSVEASGDRALVITVEKGR